MTARTPTRNIGAGWNGSTVPFITTPATRSGYATGQVVHENTDGQNIFQVCSFVANTGGKPSVALGGFAHGKQVWAENLLAAAIGKDAVVIGTEIDVGCYPSHFTCTTNGTDTLTNIVVDRYGSNFSIGDTVVSAGNIPGSTTIIAVTGDAYAPTSIQMSAAATSSADNRSVSAVHTGQIATGIAIVGEGGNIGGPGNASGVGIQIQGNTNSGFGTGFRISSTGLSAAGTGVLFAGISSTGKGIYFSSSSFGSGIEFAGGANTYTRVLFANAVNAATIIDFTGSIVSGSGIKYGTGYSGVNGINFVGAAFSNAAILFDEGHNLVVGTATGTKIGTAATQKLGFWNATPVVRPAAITGSRGGNAALADLLTKLASTGLIVDSTSA